MDKEDNPIFSVWSMADAEVPTVQLTLSSTRIYKTNQGNNTWLLTSQTA